MDLTQNSTPSFVQGQSLKSLFDPSAINSYKSEGALTQLYDGYTLKTPEFRITRWPEDQAYAYELYDLQNDPEEMINLAQQSAYSSLFRFTKKIIWNLKLLLQIKNLRELDYK